MKRYWLVFKKGEHWTQCFLKKDFGHVFVLIRDDFNWIKIDPQIEKLNVEILPVPAQDLVFKRYSNAGYNVLEIETFNTRSVFGKLVFNSCVSFVKYIIGVKLFAFTPYGLYKKLMKIKLKNKYFGNVKHVRVIW